MKHPQSSLCHCEIRGVNERALDSLFALSSIFATFKLVLTLLLFLFSFFFTNLSPIFHPESCSLFPTFKDFQLGYFSDLPAGKKKTRWKSIKLSFCPSFMIHFHLEVLVCYVFEGQPESLRIRKPRFFLWELQCMCGFWVVWPVQRVAGVVLAQGAAVLLLDPNDILVRAGPPLSRLIMLLRSEVMYRVAGGQSSCSMLIAGQHIQIK